MAKSYYVATYDTPRRDFEIDRYLTYQMKCKSPNDIKPTSQYTCTDWETATRVYEMLRETNNVIAKFEDNYLLVVTNKN